MSDTTMVSQQALTVHASLLRTNRMARKTLDGRLYAVAPVVAMIAGVRNGALLPAEDLAAFVAAWDGRPVALRHPQEGGWYVTANSPDVIEHQVLGQFFNAYMEGAALKGELWLDESKVQRLGGDALDVLRRLDDGRPLEVSVAYWADIEAGEGVFAGEPYQGVQRNLRPDHVALLPDEIGACSWADGCGAPRTNAICAACSCKERNMEEENKEVEMVVNEEAGAGEAEAAPVVETPAAQTTDLGELNDLAQFVRDFGGVAALKEALHVVTANAQATKVDLVNRLVANQQCAFGKADLEKMTVDMLQKLDRSLRPADYTGRGGVRAQAAADDDGWAPYKA